MLTVPGAPSAFNESEEVIATCFQKQSSISDETTNSSFGVGLWRTSDLPNQIKFRSPPDSPTKDIALSPDGKWLATGSWDGLINLMRTSGRGTTIEIHGPKEDLENRPTTLSLSFSFDSRFLLTVQRNRPARIWEIASQRVVAEMGSSQDWPWMGMFLPNEPVALFYDSGEFIRWDWKANKSTRLEISPPIDVRGGAVSFAPDGKALAWASKDGQQGLVDTESGRHIWSQYVAAYLIGTPTISFSSNSARFLTVSSVGTHVQETKDGKTIGRFGNQEDLVWPASLSMDGSRLVHSSPGGLWMIFDLDHGRELLRIGGRKSLAAMSLFSNDGRILVTANRFDTVIRPAFPWHEEDYPGDSSSSLGDRIEMHKRQFWRDWLGDEYPLQSQ
jgi:WD40 repeat protein